MSAVPEQLVENYIHSTHFVRPSALSDSTSLSCFSFTAWNLKSKFKTLETEVSISLVRDISVNLYNAEKHSAQRKDDYVRQLSQYNHVGTTLSNKLQSGCVCDRGRSLVRGVLEVLSTVLSSRTFSKYGILTLACATQHVLQESFS